MPPGDRQTYFAYGSNMDVEQMRLRCPGAILVGPARLPRYRFMINTQGVASVVESASHDVHGVLWLITPAHELALDDYEGVREGWYDKISVAVETADESVTAMMYIACQQTTGSPWPGYMEDIVAAAERFGFPDAYLWELRTWLRTGA